uniref:Si:ch211-161h7.5 n=1 Tax=Acanthochromis polyacanthus TaxID=80966 RepID=A0A3Q1FKY5_9TELE
MVLALVVFIITMVFSALAASGKPFLVSTGNISDEFVTEITPSGWTFAIWGIIYTFLALVLVYVLSGFFRNEYGYVYCSPAVLSHGFFVLWCLNLILNIGWLLLWDRIIVASLIFLILVASTNYSVIFFSCYGLHKYGAWLNKYHKNGVAIYATWTTIATLVNLAIVVSYDGNMSPPDAATLSLSILTVVLIVFVLENFVLDKHVRYILIVYPVVIWALSGNLDKNFDAQSPSRNGIFIVLLSISCALFVIRLILVIWRHIKQPLYEDVDP